MNGIIHRDIKPENLVFDTNGYLKITDLGIARVWSPDNSKDTSGTPGYMAPEVMRSQPQGMRVDIYSAGIVMWEILTGCIPWKGMDLVQVIHQVTQESNRVQKPPPGRPRIVPQHMHSAPPGYIQLINDCWAQVSHEAVRVRGVCPASAVC